VTALAFQATLAFVAFSCVHELGHAFAAEMLQRPVLRFEWHMFSPACVWETRGIGRAGALVAFAGPLMNLLIGLAIWDCKPMDNWATFGGLSLIVGLYNLVPFKGYTDGSHALRFLRGYRWTDQGWQR